MPRDFIPYQQHQRVAWLSTFNTGVQADIAGLGVPAAIAADLNTRHTTLMSAWAVVENPATRTTPAINAKAQAMADCVAVARTVAAIIQAMPVSMVSDQTRLDLGLPVHDTEGTPVPPPSHAPNLGNIAVVGRIVSGRLRDATESTNLGKPAGCAGALIYSHIGETLPASINGWKIEGLTTRTKFSVAFPDDLPAGTQVWITAAWRNFTDEVGPAAGALPLTLGAGNTQVA